MKSKFVSRPSGSFARKSPASAELPAYVICHDSTLKELALQAPADEAGLAGVKGLGPYKIRMYGQAFLDVLRRG